MQENNKEYWVRCKKCGHKLFRVIPDGNSISWYAGIEVKCHSCKMINYVNTIDISLIYKK